MARFKIKRAKMRDAEGNLLPDYGHASYPWKMTDAERPAFLGQYPTRERAIRAADNRVRTERGMPSRLDLTAAEILAAMHPEEATA